MAIQVGQQSSDPGERTPSMYFIEWSADGKHWRKIGTTKSLSTTHRKILSDYAMANEPAIVNLLTANHGRGRLRAISSRSYNEGEVITHSTVSVG